MLPKLIKALQNPGCYPHPVSGEIQVIETQVSWVLLTGEFAYKIKKEINFGFLDFSTLTKRLYYCEEELRLNQRLAPDIYQVVVAITGTEQQPIIGLNGHKALATDSESPIDDDSAVQSASLAELKPIVQPIVKPIAQPIVQPSQTTEIALRTDLEISSNTEKPFEYAVRMQQFDPKAGLNDLLIQNRFDKNWIDQIAEQLAKFHLTLPTVATNSPWGEPENIWQLVSDNFLHSLDFCTDPQDLSQLSELYRQITAQYQALTDTFRERRKLGFIRECHGDLHLANVTFFRGQIRLFDCIEFNLQFRWIDTCSDLAFLLMDLEANNKHSWANLTLNKYLEITGDYQSLQLLDFYKSFRSMVRAKVATLGAQAEHATFVKYLNLSQSYQLSKHPSLILMHGLSGSGKSHLSYKMIDAIQAIRIRSETERQRIHRELQKKGKKLDLHSPEVNSRLSQHLVQLTKQLLKQGRTVIVDGTFLKSHFRQKYLTISEELEIPLHIISCKCDPKLMEARLKKGINTRSHNSQFSLERLATQRQYQQAITASELVYQTVVNTDSDQAIADFLASFHPKTGS
ncbi:MAG: hypothetical protein OFPII_39570 [Osedax symbiont Rs1]|nr:MAG: hypothetical protein OFPII_39570 [Osedax symbiont Rs1]